MNDGVKKHQTWFISLGLCLATIALYWPVRHFGLVNYDDPDYIEQNWLIQQGITSKGLVWSFAESHFANWHPMVWISFMVECQIFGERPGVHHLVNVIFHAVNGSLLFILLQTWTGATWRSAFVAALFAFHPLRVESVAWITERKDVLSGLFFMLTLLAWTHHVRREEQKEPAVPLSPRSYWPALVLFALGLMTKPMLVTIPFLLLLLDFWPWQRLEERKNWRPMLIEKWPLLALAILFSAITYLVQSGSGTVLAMTPGSRCQKAVLSIPAYLAKMIWPRDLTALYLTPFSWPTGEVIVATAFVLLFSALVVAQWRTRPWLATGWFWFLGMLVPVIGLVPVGLHFIADRFTYLPCIGFFVLLTWAACDVLVKWSDPLKTLILGSAALVSLGLACGLTRTQLSTWKNSSTLWNQALRVNPANYIAHNNFGLYLLDLGQVQAARKEFDQAIKLHPIETDARINLGMIASREKDYGKAADLFQQVLNIKPGDVLAMVDLGNALRLARDFADAKPFLDKAVQVQPEFIPAQVALANFYDDVGQFDQAIPHYQILLEIRPADAMAHCNLAIDLMACRRLPEAMIHFETALRLEPNNPGFHYYHGSAWLAGGHLVEGMAELREALRLDPKYWRALNDLAWILATNPNNKVRNGAEAVQLAGRACELTGDKDTTALCRLDAAYAEAGRFAEAIATAEKARAIFLSMGATNFANKAEGRIQLYRAGKAFRN